MRPRDRAVRAVRAVRAEAPVERLAVHAGVGRDVLLGVRNAARTLHAGFTSVRDVGCFRAYTDVALRDAINAGIVPGPRMKVAGAYITVSGGGEVTGMAPTWPCTCTARRA